MSGGSRFVIDVLVDDDLLDAAARRDVVHDVEHRVLEDGAQAAGAAVALERLARDGAAARPCVNLSFTPSISKSFWYCFTSAFFGFVRMSMSASSLSSCSVARTGKRPMNSGMRPNLSRSSGCTWLEQLAELVAPSCS